MDIEIISKPSFCVIGKRGRGPADSGAAWIAPLWQNANEYIGEVLPLLYKDGDGRPTGIWGAMSDITGSFHPWGNEGLYLAGYEAPQTAEPPEGWVKWDIPAYTYAVASCALAQYGEVFGHVLQEHLPQHGYTLAGAVHEYYPQAGAPGSLQLWFPISRG